MRYKLPDYIIVTRRKLHYYSVSSSLFFCCCFSPLLSRLPFFRIACQCRTYLMQNITERTHRNWINQHHTNNITISHEPSASDSVVSTLYSHQTRWIKELFMFSIIKHEFVRTKQERIITFHWMTFIREFEILAFADFMASTEKCDITYNETIKTKAWSSVYFTARWTDGIVPKLTKRKTIFQLINFCSIDNRRRTKKRSTKAVSK